MRNHNAWKTKNISSWDLSLDGAAELNGYLNTSPDIYYFSFVFSATSKDESTGYYTPNDDVFLLIRSRAKLLASKIIFKEDGNETDSTWWENDGIVNVRSMKGPTSGENGADPIVPFVANDPLIQGQWYTFGPINLDHYQSVGHMLSKKKSKARLTLYKSRKTVNVVTKRLVFYKNLYICNIQLCTMVN